MKFRSIQSRWILLSCKPAKSMCSEKCTIKKMPGNALRVPRRVKMMFDQVMVGDGLTHMCSQSNGNIPEEKNYFSVLSLNVQVNVLSRHRPLQCLLRQNSYPRGVFLQEIGQIYFSSPVCSILHYSSYWIQWSCNTPSHSSTTSCVRRTLLPRQLCYCISVTLYGSRYPIVQCVP